MSISPNRPLIVARRAAPLALALAAGLVACAAILLVAARPASASSHVHEYPGDTPCATTLQNCIDGADDFDTIIISGAHTTSVTLNRPISLTGVSSATAILQALPGQRVLTVTGPAISGSVVISGLTFTGGAVSGVICPVSCGGGILISDTAQPLLSNLIMSGNTAYRGGGLYSTGALRLDSSLVAHNIVVPAGGGAYAEGAVTLTGGLFQHNQCIADLCQGGGLRTLSTLALTGTQFISNTAVNRGGGAYVSGAATLNGGLFERNQCTGAGCRGGGLFAPTTLALTGSSFVSNTAVSYGGGAYVGGAATLNGGLFERNQCTGADCWGGGLTAFSTLVLTGTEFISNTSVSHGGAVYAFDAATLNGALFQGNTCTDGTCQGGGLSSTGALSVQTSRFLHNTAGGAGGGLRHTNDDGSVTNSLFAGNTAGEGAALYLASAGSTTLLHNTIAMPSGQVVTAAVTIDGGSAGITNTLFANHATGILLLSGTAHQDFNLFANVAMSVTAGVTGGDDARDGAAGLVNPAGGDYRIGGGSDAINTGANAGVLVDFFGTTRPVGGGFDIGFHEYFSRLYLPVLFR